MGLLGTLTVWLTGNGSEYSKMLQGAQRDTQSFVQSASSAFKGLAGAFTLGAAGASALRNYVSQENAIKRLSAALRGGGDDANIYMSRFSDFASEMQRQTVYGDEFVMQQMSYARNLGVTTERLEEAAKAAAGLSAKLGIDLSTSMMLVGKASQGHYETLGRYGLTLDETLTKEQKFNKLLEIGASSFGLAKSETETFDGKLKQLGNTFGDFMEDVGGQLSTFLKPFMEMASSAFKWLNSLSEGTRTMIARATALALSGGALYGVVKASAAAMTLMSGALALSTSAMAKDTAATIANTAAHSANQSFKKLRYFARKGGAFDPASAMLASIRRPDVGDYMGPSEGALKIAGANSGSVWAASFNNSVKSLFGTLPSILSTVFAGAGAAIVGYNIGRAIARELDLWGEKSLEIAERRDKELDDKIAIMQDQAFKKRKAQWESDAKDAMAFFRNLTNDSTRKTESEIALAEQRKKFAFEDADPAKKTRLLSSEILALEKDRDFFASQKNIAGMNNAQIKINELYRERKQIADSIDAKAGQDKDRLQSIMSSNAAKARAMYMDSLSNEARLKELVAQRLDLERRINIETDPVKREELKGRRLDLDADISSLQKEANRPQERKYALSAAMQEGSAEAYSAIVKFQTQGKGSETQDAAKKTAENTKTLVDVMKDIRSSFTPMVVSI